MSIQQQLAQPQHTRQQFQIFQAHTDETLLGNRGVQVPRGAAGVERLTELFRHFAADLAPVAHTESDEMAWLVQNAHELGQYKGEWLLIQGQQLIVHSRDFADVRTAIRERHLHSPFMYYVPTDEESNSITI